jgi:hypothetical protein
MTNNFNQVVHQPQMTMFCGEEKTWQTMFDSSCSQLIFQIHKMVRMDGKSKDLTKPDDKTFIEDIVSRSSLLVTQDPTTSM